MIICDLLKRRTLVDHIDPFLSVCGASCLDIEMNGFPRTDRAHWCVLMENRLRDRKNVHG